MTNEEAIAFLEQYINSEVYTEKCISAHEMAITALRSAHAGEPMGYHFPDTTKIVPLTLEQLLEMDGQPVWVRVSENWRESGIHEGWMLIRFHGNDDRIRAYTYDTHFGATFHAQQDYGISWWAYAYPPAHIDREEWVSVEERLPEDEKDGETVLVIVFGKPHENITLHGAIMTAGYFRDEGWVLNEYPEWEGPEVTHWMPLPSPPAELEKRLRGGEGVSMSFDLCSFCRHNPPSACDGKPCTMCPASGRLITTNADRIRAMSDQELAAFLSGVCYGRDEPWERAFKAACCDCCPTVKGTDEYGRRYNLHECDFEDGVCPHGDSILWWLVRPQQVE